MINTLSETVFENGRPYFPHGDEPCPARGFNEIQRPDQALVTLFHELLPAWPGVR
jgi:hypothetical protein